VLVVNCWTALLQFENALGRYDTTIIFFSCGLSNLLSMKKSSLFAMIVSAIGFFLISGCSSKQIDLSEQSKEEIIAADLAMSDLAQKEGFHKALLAYSDDSVVKPSEGEFPVIGKEALTKYWSGKTDITTITWKPFKAEAARSGELGYTLGNWKLAAGDSTYNGFYYTIWKKQSDGKWKFTVDGGNNTPSRQE
jgi:ketosteroid isomerase-like protein